MKNLKVRNKREAQKISAKIMRQRRISKGKNPNIASDGKPYTTIHASSIVEGQNTDAAVIFINEEDEKFLSDSEKANLRDQAQLENEFKIKKRIV